MSALVAALLLAASCEHPALATMSAARQEEACALLATAHPSAQVDRAKLSAIYERPGFATARARDAGALKALLAQVRLWLESFFESSGAEAYSNVTRFLVLVAGCAIAAFAVLRLLARVRARKTPVTGSRTAGGLKLEEPPVHLARARELLSTDPRAAIREGLLSLLSELERQRLARPDRVKTNHELALELPSRGAGPDLVSAVAAVLSWYDRAFYSLDPVPAADAARFLDDVTALGTQVSAMKVPA